MSPNLAAGLYLASGVLFILALRGLSSPATSRRGNYAGMLGMAIAMATTLAIAKPELPITWYLLGGGLALGGLIGAVTARRIPMTAMPELVAAFHSLVGLAAVFVAASALYAPDSFGIGSIGDIHPASLIEMSLGVAIGAITFTGSVIAFSKLSGRMSGKPILLPARHAINLALFALLVWLIYAFWQSGGAPALFWGITATAMAFGILIIIPIGGADMPVVISMLNSYSGWAAAGIGFTLSNIALIVTGALVGSSGAILSYIMCKGMNRSFISVILGGFGGEVAGPAGRAEARQARLGGGRRLRDEERVPRHHRAGLRHGGGAGPARAARDGRQPQEGGCRGQIRDPPRRGPHAGAHERASGRSQRALRRGVRARGHQ
jgi:proton-translocating NAD(P)+ transhydrogenase subunit beta